MSPKPRPRHPDAPTPALELDELHRSFAEDRFVALVRQERMMSFVGSVADAREDELRAAFGLALLAVREAHADATNEQAAAARADAMPARSPRSHAESEALRMLAMQLIDIGDGAPDDTPDPRPRKRSMGH
jgi:hypothetical protein